ncbi:SCO3374 family protein [Streptomyces sp. NRRL F-5065]|uniref:SCO3374 family protein n=1 Tax=Streptomyces sp. NRRL F-5065 TaxID=1463855 RepID=UPI00055BBC73|nr:SCO3374 family protein [Streptomyces sp. NRRL F-5065]
MVRAPSPAPLPSPASPAAPPVDPGPAATVPGPRRPPAADGTPGRVRWWYERVLGWPTEPGTPDGPAAPVRLRTGVRFDVLDVPAEAGHATLDRTGPAAPAFPVAVRGGRMLLFVSAGGAEELPGLLEWLEWGSLALDLTAVGAGGLVDAPPPPGTGSAGRPPLTGDDGGAQGAARWLRPPDPAHDVEDALPSLSAIGGSGAPDLARLLHTLATEVHRVRLGRATR